MNTRVLFSLLILAVTSPALTKAANYDEVIDGDISGTMGMPTAFSLGLGANSLSATTVAGDEEYVKVTVPVGNVLKSIILDTYSGADKSFIGIQNGSVFTVAPGGMNKQGLLGWTEFGPTGVPVGTNILDDMGSGGSGATGFTPPLSAGTYTIWLNEPTAVAVTYTLTFNVAAQTFLAPLPVKPKGSTNLTTTSSKIKIRGKLGDSKKTPGGPVTLVQYKVGKRAFKPATGTISWSFVAKRLKHGRNIIKIVAVGPGGQSAAVRVKVVRS